ncbi:MAG: hypothetical protein IKS52_08630 [Clostridia bacterium]|nr:hypothetical protein [Clostridia bacterium]MBR4443317.1 hypothetical protein [Clostridia bacterium]
MRDHAAETHIFEHSSILTAVLKLAIPTVISQIILVVYNMADTYFISLTDNTPMITAVTVCMPAFMFLSAISNLFGVGGASVIARALGSRDIRKARRAASFAFWGCVALTLVYSLGAWALMDGFVDTLGGSIPQVHENARSYLMVTVVIGGVATSLNALLGHLVRSEGRSMHAGFGIALGGVLNIVLDPLFMFVILEPGNEVLGAGIATSLSNLIATCYFLTLIFRHRQKSVLSLRPTSKGLREGIPRDVLTTGLPACLMTLCENISYAVLDNLMAATRILACQAGIGVAKKVNMLAHCMVRGMAQGVLPLIGYNYSAGDHRRMKSAIIMSTSISVGLAALWMAASLVFSRELVGIFLEHDPEALDYGARFLRILCVGGPFSACAYAFISFFQATGESVKSFVLAILRKGVLDIPLMFLLLRLIPIYGIVWATPIADTACCVAAVLLFTRFVARLPHAAPAASTRAV